MHPATIQPSAKEDLVGLESLGDELKFALSYDGNPMGFLDTRSDGWCNFSPNGQLFSPYIYSDGKTYYKAEGGDWDGYYLSVSKGAYVGLYSWSNATGWKLENGKMLSQYNNQCLSFYTSDNPYVYAWNDYNIFTVRKQR